MLFELIKKSQFEEDIELTSSDCDWNKIYEEAMNQAITGIIAYEIPANIRLLDARWQRAQDKHIADQIRYSFAEKELSDVLDNARIPFVVLKGTSAAAYYKHPERRMMGDIDFLVSCENFERTVALLVENGYKKESVTHTTRHISFFKGGISFELHHHFSHEGRDIESYLTEGLTERTYCEFNGFRFPMLPRLANGLVLLEHMREHLITGLGLRQVIDWMMYVSKELTDHYWESEFSKVAEDKGLEKFAIVTTRMCQLYLGLSENICWCKCVDDSLCSRLLELILLSGNFGRKNTDANSVEAVRTQIKRYGLFKWLQISGERNWGAYKKHHILRPLCWFYQSIRYLKRGWKMDRSINQISDDFERGDKRSSLLKELEL